MKNKEIISLNARVEAIDMSKKELAEQIKRTSKLMQLDLQKLDIMIDVAMEKPYQSLSTIESLELHMTMISAYFEQYRRRFQGCFENNLDSLPSTISDPIEEHTDDFDHGTK